MSKREQVEQANPGRRAGNSFSRKVLGLSPDRLIAVLAVLIFVAEACDMYLLSLIGELPAWSEALLDSTILLAILSPAYFCLYRPFWVERQRAEEDIRRLSRQMIRAEETTRKALARDLHDEFGQMLTALQFGVETLRNTLPVQPEQATAQCERLTRMIAQLGTHVRDVTAELRPTMLDSLGLVPTLRWHARQFRQRHPGIRIEVETTGGEERLPPEVEVALYRVCQESLNNVAKHARASRVRVALQRGEERLTLSIADDGVGFEVRRRRDDPDQQGFGILGMRERIADLGGCLAIDSRPGAGTTVRAEFALPIQEER
jgi:two-component system sensor histidine kinase UhpB